jgi:hypothetical protein
MNSVRAEYRHQLIAFAESQFGGISLSFYQRY